MKRFTETTSTTLIMDALVQADDFLTVRDLMAHTGRTSNQVASALHMLRHYNAVEAMDVDGCLYWYSTAEHDTRMRKIDERMPERKPRGARKPRAPRPTEAK